MPMTDKKRKTDAAWKKRNLITIGCKLYRNDAEKFRTYAEAQGQSVQSLLRAYVAQCIGPLERRDGSSGISEAEGNPGENLDN